MLSRTRHGSLLLGVLTVSCATAPKPPEKTAPPPVAPRLEKMREPLEVLPLELFFSGVRGVATSTESVTIRNTGDASVAIGNLLIVGSQASTFKLTSLPALPLLLRPNLSVTVSVGFAPPADTEPGVHRARLRIVRSDDDDGPPCDMSALVSKGTDPASEPTVQQILDTLGYAPEKEFSASDGQAGQGLSGLFQPAKPGNVGLYVVARYSQDELSSYGTYTLQDGKPVSKPLGTIAKGHNQTLNPELDGEGQTSFDPGAGTFGVFVKLPKRTLYSEDQRNGEAAKHAMHVYPLRSRGGAPVPDSLLVLVDEDGDGDFQDYVFTLVNAKPVL